MIYLITINDIIMLINTYAPLPFTILIATSDFVKITFNLLRFTNFNLKELVYSLITALLFLFTDIDF